MSDSSCDIVIYDAIHTVMRLPRDLRDILDLPVVQRLRSIKQMSLADLVFPTATHSRFSHALGTCHVALRMLQQLRHHLPIDDDLERHVAMAALLHDIGHGPFSHAFELFLSTSLAIDIRHEEWTEYFLEETELAELLSKRNFDTRLLLQLITLKGEARKTALGTNSDMPYLLLASDIIASQLDSDRLDYLLRDSHFSGVSNGTYDLDWLINCLHPVETNEGYRLGINSKGVGVIESFLMARRLMYKNIYYNAKLVALERILIDLLREVRRLLPEDCALQKIISPPLAKFLENLVPGAYEDSEDFRRAKFSQYRQLCDFDLWSLVRSIGHPSFSITPPREKLKHLALRFQRRRCPKIFRVNPHNFTHDHLQGFRKKHGLHRWQLDLVPISFQLYGSQEDPIWIAEERLGHAAPAYAVPLSQQSELVERLSDHIEPQSYLMIDEAFYLQNNALLQCLDKQLQCP